MATLPFPAPMPMPAVARILSRFDRTTLEAFLSVAIDLIDTFDGDADTEENGDEQDTADAEDEPQTVPRAGGPGCAITDPDMGAEDYACDPEEDMCIAGDDGCGPVVMHGRIYWGADDPH